MPKSALALAALPWAVAACAAHPPAARRAPVLAEEAPRVAAVTVGRMIAAARATATGDGRVLELGVGADSVCAILGDRTVRCRARAEGPVVTRALPPARDLVVGGDRGCVHDNEGTPWCWGHAWWCGAGERLDPSRPERVASLPRGASIALPPTRLNDSGGGLLARTEDGLVRGLWCNDEGPAELTEFAGPVRQLSLGRSTACALLAEGVVRCREDLGPLQAVAGVASPRAVVVGIGYACVLGGDGGVGCWPVCEYHEGDGGRGTACGAWERRGRRRDEGPAPDIEPLPVEGVAGLTALALGEGFGCGVTGDRAVVCWTFPPPPRHRRRTRRSRLRAGAPFPVPGMSDVERVVAEGDTLCALRGDATVWCASPPTPGARATQVRWE